MFLDLRCRENEFNLSMFHLQTEFFFGSVSQGVLLLKPADSLAYKVQYYVNVKTNDHGEYWEEREAAVLPHNTLCSLTSRNVTVFASVWAFVHVLKLS